MTAPSLVRTELGSPRRPAAASASDSGCLSRKQSLGLYKGLEGAATRQPFRPELEPSASQPAPRVLRRLLGTVSPPLLTTALHGRGIVATVQMWKKAQRAYVACILLQFCLHADGKVVF